jgi:hypothetical protein
VECAKERFGSPPQRCVSALKHNHQVCLGLFKSTQVEAKRTSPNSSFFACRRKCEHLRQRTLGELRRIGIKGTLGLQ